MNTKQYHIRGMLMRSQYELLQHRITKPENKEKLKKCVVDPHNVSEELLHLYVKHSEDFLIRLEKYAEDDFVKTYFLAILKMIEKLLDEKGWKN